MPAIGPIRYMPASEMTPDAGPLALYQSVWPERYLRWSVGRQCWDLRARDPVTGDDERIELLRAVGEDGELGYRPFDYAYVRGKLRQRMELLELGAVGYVNRIADRNRQREVKKLLGWKTHLDDWAREERRWLPALEAAQRLPWAYDSELKSERVPLVPVTTQL